MFKTNKKLNAMTHMKLMDLLILPGTTKWDRSATIYKLVCHQIFNILPTFSYMGHLTTKKMKQNPKAP